MGEQRKYTILFVATILAARRISEIGVKPCPGRERAIADAGSRTPSILEKINERWPNGTD